MDTPSHSRPGASTLASQEIHITCQFRDGMAMVYDLKAGPRRIELRMQASPASAGWSLAMTIKGGDSSRSQSADGTTRRCALETLERSFGDSLSTDQWKGLRAALGDVRALERQ